MWVYPKAFRLRRLRGLGRTARLASWQMGYGMLTQVTFFRSFVLTFSVKRLELCAFPTWCAWVCVHNVSAWEFLALLWNSFPHRRLCPFFEYYLRHALQSLPSVTLATPVTTQQEQTTAEIVSQLMQSSALAQQFVATFAAPAGVPPPDLRKRPWARATPLCGRGRGTSRTPGKACLVHGKTHRGTPRTQLFSDVCNIAPGIAPMAQARPGGGCQCRDGHGFDLDCGPRHENAPTPSCRRTL